MRDYLKQNKLIADGAFGTYYAEKYETAELPELANELYPQRVEAIHKAYMKAGAKLIRTNTFASNSKKNILAAVEIARKAVALEQVFIAGDIGPISVTEHDLSDAWLEEQYFQIACIFLEAGIDILTFETFPDLEHLLPALHRIREEYGKAPFIMVQFAVNQFGYSNSGLSARRLLQEAGKDPAIDAIGLNCGVGPGHMEQILHKIELTGNKYLITLPNAGYPIRISNRMQFANNPDYFSTKVSQLLTDGVDIAGGCCGTDPGFIEQLVKTANLTQMKKSPESTENREAAPEPAHTGFFYDKAGVIKPKKLIAVELAPPLDADDESLLEAAHALKMAGVDVLTFPDSPSGRTRVDSVLMAEKVKNETGLEVMPHICCRDKNAIAMRSLFLGAHINGIHNMLLITGDPIPALARQAVKAVFNFDAVGLMEIAQDMNEEHFGKLPITYGGAINQGRPNLEVEIERVRKKLSAGAEFFFTQPVFTKEDAKKIRQIKEETGARILCGIMPLISRRNALFMKNEIAGIPVTEEIVNRYPENGTKEEGEAVGVAIAKEVISYTEDFVNGYYFSFPFNKVYLLQKILK